MHRGGSLFSVASCSRGKNWPWRWPRLPAESGLRSSAGTNLICRFGGLGRHHLGTGL